MEITEQNTNKVQVAARVEPDIYAAIEKLARDDERTISNTIERLLKGNPQIQELLETATAAAH